MTTSERAYRAMLRVFPRSFRSQYEEEMVRLFLDQLRDAEHSSGVARAGLWLRSVADIASSAPGEHLRREATMAKPIHDGSVALDVSAKTGPTRLGYALASLPFLLLVGVGAVAPGWLEPLFSNPPEILGLPAGVVAVFLASTWASLAFVGIRQARSGIGIALSLLVFTIPSMIAIGLLPSLILIILNLNV